MKIAIATVQAPFIRGGAELLAEGLLAACRAADHQAEIVSMPFRFAPDHEVARAMTAWETEDFTRLNGHSPDVVIDLKFPAYYLQHPNQRLWLLHQHRVAYDLWRDDGPLSVVLRDEIRQRDSAYLGRISQRFTIAENVCARLRRFNGLESRALYPPPLHPERFYRAEALPYIFFPSRLEKLKRQSLLIEAMAQVHSPVAALIAGAGGEMTRYAELIERHGLGDRVRLLGAITEQELQSLYAHCLGVFYGPYDEDYGYVTLEAMLSGKPVITCTDSGGPLEFVTDQQTGLIVDPNPAAIAQAIEFLASRPRVAASLGAAGYEKYQSLNMNWDWVLEQLLGSQP
ncbi:MAG: glycosyltransferase family 4 protein [Candidatus Competibacteraceae bacterium]|nr:glycosyltransferase family 4 protein [Candidatus Competibacteraceae bacterium]